MKRTLVAAGILAATASGALSGGIDRARTDTGLLFEDGDRIKLSFTLVDPSVSGSYSPAFGPFAGTSTGDMASTYSTLGFGYKNEINDRFAIALLVDEPYGADAFYSQGPYSSLEATWRSESVTVLAHYRFDDNWSVYGGPRAVRSRADVAIPPAILGAAGRYTGRIDNETDYGVVVGAAYEIPEIALRVALTYQSEIDHDFTAQEAFTNPAIGSLVSPTAIELPRAVTLDFQTGVAADTLVFGSLRWSEWSVFDVRPSQFQGVTGESVARVRDDIWGATLGIGRRVRDNLSLFARVGYEDRNGSVVARLAPTDGRRSIGVGGTYTVGSADWTAAIEYVDLGDAGDSAGTRFEDNDALALGVSVSFGF